MPLAAGFAAGAALALGLAQAGRGVAKRWRSPPAPAERQAAPPRPLNDRPYVPPIRIGLGPGISISPISPISGARAPLRDSAVLRRDGEAS